MFLWRLSVGALRRRNRSRVIEGCCCCFLLLLGLHNFMESSYDSQGYHATPARSLPFPEATDNKAATRLAQTPAKNDSAIPVDAKRTENTNSGVETHESIQSEVLNEMELGTDPGMEPTVHKEEKIEDSPTFLLQNGDEPTNPGEQQVADSSVSLLQGGDEPIYREEHQVEEPPQSLLETNKEPAIPGEQNNEDPTISGEQMGEEQTTAQYQQEEDSVPTNTLPQEVAEAGNDGAAHQPNYQAAFGAPVGDDNVVKTITWLDFNGAGIRNHAYHVDFGKCATYKNCQFKFELLTGEDDPGLHRDTPLDGDAVLVQSNRIETLPPPPRRDPNQVFVMVEREAGAQLNSEMTQTNATKMWAPAVNWTMTYRLDSDIPYRYGSIRARESGNAVPTKNYDEIFDAKTDDIVWLVSHCKTKSRREEYVQALQQYTPVEILGECGKPEVCPHHNRDCLGDLARQYKFYLAFENTFHTDYVTEKFFSWFRRDLITIVRGESNYSKIAPPGTYINARDFRSPEELGRFLNELSKDRARYTEYLKRKDQYESLDQWPQTQEAYCTMCDWLHTLDAHRRTYPHVGKWWIQGFYNLKKVPKGTDVTLL